MENTVVLSKESKEQKRRAWKNKHWPWNWLKRNGMSFTGHSYSAACDLVKHVLAKKATVDMYAPAERVPTRRQRKNAVKRAIEKQGRVMSKEEKQEIYNDRRNKRQKLQRVKGELKPRGKVNKKRFRKKIKQMISDNVDCNNCDMLKTDKLKAGGCGSGCPEYVKQLTELKERLGLI